MQKANQKMHAFFAFFQNPNFRHPLGLGPSKGIKKKLQKCFWVLENTRETSNLQYVELDDNLSCPSVGFGPGRIQDF